MQGIKLRSVTTTQWQSGKASGYWQQLIPLDRKQAASTSLFVFCIFLEAKGHLSLCHKHVRSDYTSLKFRLLAPVVTEIKDYLLPELTRSISHNIDALLPPISWSRDEQKTQPNINLMSWSFSNTYFHTQEVSQNCHMSTDHFFQEGNVPAVGELSSYRNNQKKTPKTNFNNLR